MQQHMCNHARPLLFLQAAAMKFENKIACIASTSTTDFGFEKGLHTTVHAATFGSIAIRQFKGK
jgi:hypothetical protein